MNLKLSPSRKTESVTTPSRGMQNVDLKNFAAIKGFDVMGAGTYAFCESLTCGDYSGYSVRSAGDVNGDGYPDIIIGAYQESQRVGAAYVVFGNVTETSYSLDLAALSSSKGFKVIGQSIGDCAGWSVSGAGDFNNDGYDDIIIGAPNACVNCPNTDEGKVYLVYGAKTFSGEVRLNNLSKGVGFTMKGISQGSYAGISVSYAGDINKDGYDDFVVGAHGIHTAYIIFGSKNSPCSATGPCIVDLLTISTQQGFKIVGSSSFGYSVSGAGDFNDDGYGDIVIGALNSNSGAGASYLIYGKNTSISDITLSNLLPEQGFKIFGNQAGDLSGCAVSKAGDVNNDGYDDILIGAPGSRSYAGEFYVIFGRSALLTNLYLSSLLQSDGFKIIGANAGNQSPYSTGDAAYGELSNQFISNAGDINGDGYDDFIISAYSASPDQLRSNAGITYVILGKDSFNNIFLENITASQGFTIYGANGFDYSGYAVAAAGDVNKDGYDDIIIGAFQADSSGSGTEGHNAGITYVILDTLGTFSPTSVPTTIPTFSPTHQPSTAPTAAPTTLPSLSPTSPTTLPTLSPSVDPTQNPSADPTFIPSAIPTHSPTLAPTLMPSTIPTQNPSLDPTSIPSVIPSYLPTLAPTLMPSTTPTQSPTPDPTFIPSAIPTHSPTLAPTLMPSTIPTQNPSLDPTFIPSVIPTHSPTLFPTFMPSAPTTSPTFIPTALPTSSPTISPTMPYISLPNIKLENLLLSQGIKVLGAVDGDKSGDSVSTIGDVNGDGYDDVIIGSPFAMNRKGISYVIYGKSAEFSNIDLNNMTSNQGIEIQGASSGDQSGCSVSGANDINNDRYDDIIIGAHLASYNSRINAGITYVLYGSKNLSNMDITSLSFAQGFSIYGANSYDFSGYSVSGAGDVNGDGYDDIVIGAYSSGSDARSNSGIVYVIFGQKNNFNNIDLATLATNQGFKILGARTNDYSGYSVASAGDMNGDGYDEIIIGSYGATGRSGTSYVVFGSADLSTDLDLLSLSLERGFKIIGSAVNDQSGWSVSSAGDINGDGYDEVIVGAPGSDPSGSRIDAGISYIIFGKKSGFSDVFLSSDLVSNGQGFLVLGANTNDNSGYSVNKAGDVNGDGYADIIIGATRTSSAGAAYIIFGKSTGFSNIDLRTYSALQLFQVLGEQNGGYTGCAVSTAGDFNNDGYDDIVIGSFYANNEAGVSYILYDATATASPIFAPSMLPTSFVSTDSSEAKAGWYDNIEFKSIVSLGFSALSFIFGWVFREKIAYHILSNWGYKYVLLYKEDEHTLQTNKIGFILSTAINNQNSQDEIFLFCKKKDKYFKIVIDNGNNNGLSEGLYDTIVDALTGKQPEEPFIFLKSEESKILDYLQSYNLFDFSDLGFLRGNVYKVCLTKYKSGYKERYARNIRIQKDELDHNPMHEQTRHESKDLNIEFKEFNTDKNIEIGGNSENELNSVKLSIDAMMDPEHVEAQNAEFLRFTNHLVHFITEDLPKDINWLIASQSNAERLLLEESSKEIHAIAIYEVSTSKNNNQFDSPYNLMPSILNAKQILYNLPLIHYLAQNSINYLGYNVTLSDPLDNKAVLISIDLVLGNLAAQYLPAENIINGILISTASTVSYAVRLTVADYLKNQEPSAEPIEFAQQCASTIAAYTLPGLVNYALTKAILPDAKMSISTLDMLGSSSFGVVQCYNNYKTVYGTETQATTAADVVVPYIADVITLWSLRGCLNLDSSNTANLMMSIKNAMSVAATTYAVHCVSNMVMDVVPQEVKEEYIDPVFNFASNTINDVANSCYQSVTDVSEYIAEEVGLLMDYVGTINLREEL